MAAEKTIKLAVLIDADNAQPSMSGLLLAEVAKYGTACVKRAYGDWTGPGLTGWKGQLLKQGIQPVQQFAYTHGKNATDMAMIIDAMDLLYSNKYDGFCLISSDSDFTRLAVRIREAGLPVHGFGNRTTPAPFVVSCNRFVYVENLAINEEHGTEASPQKQYAAALTDVTLTNQLETAIEAASEDDGWAMLADVGSLIMKRHPDFDPRSYGHSKLSSLVAAISIFEVTRRSPGKSKADVVYLCWPIGTRIPQFRVQKDTVNIITCPREVKYVADGAVEGRSRIRKDWIRRNWLRKDWIRYNQVMTVSVSKLAPRYREGYQERIFLQGLGELSAQAHQALKILAKTSYK
ncbi:NYN domain-containing protein [Cladorrhinum sp. PSN259]|nr:NYN domain-containing protein [Cladorrhinum sp. PSN259]